MPDVNISYKGSQIASMEGSGVKTLLTSGKYCEDDIFVSYNKIGNATAEGDSSVSVTDAESGNICSLIQYGVCEQDAQTNAISCNNGTLSVSSGEIVTTAANREAIALGSQTATVENLYSVGNIRDEQELVTGTVIRKNAVCIYDGTQPVGDRYISSTGAKDNGAIIIYPLETEHTGDSIVSFTETVKQDVNSLEASIEPIQDLHGYSNPWPAGGGVNILPPPTSATAGASGTITDNNGLLTISTTGENVTFTIRIPEFTFAESGQKIELLNSFTNGTVYFLNGSTQIDFFSLSSVNRVVSESSMSALKGKTIDRYRITVNAQTLTNATFAMMVTDSSASALTAFSPYSNICPISGRTGLSVFVGPTTAQADATTYAVDWTSEAGTVYGGTDEVVGGVLTDEWAEIPSYNGETITEPWLSSMDEYAPGATPTTGAQVVYKLATPLTYQLTAQEVETLVGANNIFSPDATSIKVAVSNPVIEYVAPQPLTLAEGSNTVSATNLSVSSVPLELNYISKAAQPTSVAKKDVNFIDYDGTLLYSYTASEFANLSALPDNPSHEGLIAQGWNWSLADAKTYVASYGKLWIGQMYITESGDTEIDIELHAPRLSPYLGLAVNGAVEVDWGDGTAKSTVTGTDTDLTTQIMTPHVYATDGSYTIKIHAVSGSFSLCGSAWNSVLSGNFSSNSNNVYSNTVQRVRIGSSMPSIYSAFSGCYSLTSITIPSGVTSISGNAFQSCYSLASITIPSGVTSIDSSAFSNCSSLTSITIPSGVTSIGNSAFYYCFSLALIPIPSGVTSISYRIFYYCYSLTSIMIPSEVTSIGSNAFDHCYSLASITIPSGVTSISGSAFYYCSGLGLIRFERTTPPSVSSSNAWTNIPTDCIILIPYDSDSYIGATNYPSSSTYSYVGYMTSVSGESLPTQTSLIKYPLVWYATKEEAVSQTGTPLTQGNGNEIYCHYVVPTGGGTND